MTMEIDQGPALRARNILLVCTRDPRGRITGRKMVLKTIVDSLTGLGHGVTVAHFGPAEAPEAQPGAKSYVTLPGPSLAERLVGAARWLFSGAPPLNEALYRSRRAEAALKDLAHETGAEIVVTDMLRTAVYGASLGLVWIADLDDLLSRRYRLLARNYDAHTNVMGYYNSAFGRFAQRFGARLMPWVLRREAAAIERREIEVASAADATTLVSAFEAQMLSRAAGRPVRSAPMAVTGPPDLPAPDNRPRELVFLGGLDYGPNLKSVRQFDTEIVPRLVAQGISEPKLHVIGYPGKTTNGFSDAVIPEGYVADLDSAIRQYRAMLVPEVLPGGVKTKILVAAMNGTLVLAHPTAVEGMELRHGRDILLWNTGDELAERLRQLRSGDIDTAAMVSSARAWAEARHSPAVLKQIWRDLLAEALNRDGNRPEDQRRVSRAALPRSSPPK